MKTGDEAYIKSEGEGAVRRIIDGFDSDFCSLKKTYGVYVLDELEHLKPNHRLVSELPEIARMTGCYVAVDKSTRIVLGVEKMVFYKNRIWMHTSDEMIYRIPITCPNCEDFSRQWGPDGEVL